jgi:sulfur-oxidizing protein SoxX
MHTTIRTLLLLAALPLVATAADHAHVDHNAEAYKVMKTSFEAKGQAGMDRLKQDPTQKACSKYEDNPPPKINKTLLEANQKTVKYPADGKYLGNWKRGMDIANDGKGLQYNDNPKAPSGGNCYACHQLDKAHIAYGTIGPSLYHYGKNRGFSKAAIKLTWSMLYDIKGYSLCSAMPRFGARHILTQQQMKDIMALLYDPDSPVNK